MYKVGDWFGVRILETGKFKYIPIENVHKVEAWFKKYGYWIVIANRFLAGTRAVVSFFTGMSELSLGRTALLSFLSSLLWNFILLFAGKELGINWKDISAYLVTYGKVVSIIIIIAIIIFIAWNHSNKRNLHNASGNSTSTNHSNT
jgi:membrane protein DedA with SNARE-associated domain